MMTCSCFAFFADPAIRARHVVAGQFLGIGALTAASLAGSLLALVAHPRSGPTVRRLAAPVTPVVLMAVGVLVVLEAGTHTLFL